VCINSEHQTVGHIAAAFWTCRIERRNCPCLFSRHVSRANLARRIIFFVRLFSTFCRLFRLFGILFGIFRACDERQRLRKRNLCAATRPHIRDIFDVLAARSAVSESKTLTDAACSDAFNWFCLLHFLGSFGWELRSLRSSLSRNKSKTDK